MGKIIPRIDDIVYNNYMETITDDDLIYTYDSPEFNVLFNRHYINNDDILVSRIATCAHIASLLIKEYCSIKHESDIDVYKYANFIMSIFHRESLILGRLYDEDIELRQDDELVVLYDLLLKLIIRILKLVKNKKYKKMIKEVNQFVKDMLTHITRTTSSVMDEGHELFYVDSEYGIAFNYIKFILQTIIMSAYNSGEDIDIDNYNLVSNHLDVLAGSIIENLSIIYDY